MHHRSAKNTAARRASGNRGACTLNRSPRDEAREPRCLANLAANRVWLGFEWLAPFHEGCHLMNKEMWKTTDRVIRDHERDLPLSCVYLSMLSHCRTKDEVKFVDQQKWGELTLEGTYHVLKTFAKKTTRGMNILHLKCEGDRLSAEMQMIPGKAEHRDNFLIVPALKGSALHILPLGKIKKDVVIAAPPSMRPDDAKREPKSSGPAIVAESVISLDDSSSSSSSTAPQGQEKPAVVQPAVDTSQEELDFVLVEKEECHLVRYQGVFPPPIHWQWVDGWWPSTAPRDVESRRTVAKTIASGLLLPDVCSATVGMVRKFRELPLYLPVGKDVKHPLCLLPRKQLTDGQGRMETAFAEGDTVRIDGVAYLAVAEQKFGASLLRLVSVDYGLSESFSRSVRKTLGGLSSQFLGAKSVQAFGAGVPKLRDESVRQAEWIAVVHSSVDPLETSILQRLRQDAAAAKYGPQTERAEECAKFARNLRKVYPGLTSVAGRFGWGYCYSCGAELPGKFKGRLCRCCQKTNSCSVARAVAEGAKVCSMAKPVLYPGVVHTETQHPALKAGTKTLATPSNFRLAPSGWRPRWPAHRSSASARAWGVWP